MGRSLTFSNLFATLLVTTITLSAFSPAGAVVTYSPGVAFGNWAKYGQVSASWTSSILGQRAPPPIADFLSTTWVRTNVSAVSGQEITAKQTRMFTNGTVRETTLAGNVESGQGNLTFWIISGGLNPGDKIYNNETAPTLNATISRAYLGSVRTVNVLNITLTIAIPGGSGSFTAIGFWDKPTGVLMELHYTENFSSLGYSASGSATAIITETNLWTTQPDFAVYTSPTKTLETGSSAQSTVYLTSLNGFAGDVAVTASIDYEGTINGLSASFDRTVSKLTADGTNSSILTVTAAASTPAGYYSINLTAASDIGAYHYGHYVLISVQVNSSPVPGTYIPGVVPSDEVEYGTVRTYWNSILPTVPKPPLIADFENVNSVNLEVGSVSGTTVTAVQTRVFTNGTSRTVTVSGDVNSGFGNLYPWIIAGGLGQGDRIVNQPLFPTINSTIQRNYAGATRLVNVFNFTFSLQGVNTKLVYFWDKTTGVLLEQFYNITATGFVEGLSDVRATSTNIWSPAEPDFQITSTPGSLTLQNGSTITSTITFRSLNGFAGTIQTSTVPSPGLSASLDRESVSLEAGQTETSTLSLSSASDLYPGNYNVNVTGSSNSLSHTITVSVMVTPAPLPPDFMLTITSSSVSVQAGSSTTVGLTITPQNGLTGSVSLTVSAPNGITVGLNPPSVTGFGTSTMTVAADSALVAGSYDVILTATKGSLSHSRTISVTVKAATVSRAPLVFGLDPTIFYTSIIAIILAALSILVFALRRRTRPVSSTTGTPSVP